MSFSSSCAACPLTWTPRDLAEEHVRAQAVEVVDRAVDELLVSRDMAEDEETTVSPGSMLMWRWSRLAIRTRAEVGSPWAPVVMIVICSGGSFFMLVQRRQQVLRRVR